MSKIYANFPDVLRLILQELEAMSFTEDMIEQAEASIQKLIEDNTSSYETIKGIINKDVRLKLLDVYATEGDDAIGDEDDYVILFKVLMALSYCWPANDPYHEEGSEPDPHKQPQFLCPVTWNPIGDKEPILFLSGHIFDQKTVDDAWNFARLRYKHLIFREQLKAREIQFVQSFLPQDRRPLIPDYTKYVELRAVYQAQKLKQDVILILITAACLMTIVILCFPFIPAPFFVTLIGSALLGVVSSHMLLKINPKKTPANDYEKWQQQQNDLGIAAAAPANVSTMAFLNKVKKAKTATITTDIRAIETPAQRPSIQDAIQHSFFGASASTPEPETQTLLLANNSHEHSPVSARP